MKLKLLLLHSIHATYGRIQMTEMPKHLNSQENIYACAEREAVAQQHVLHRARRGLVGLGEAYFSARRAGHPRQDPEKTEMF